MNGSFIYFVIRTGNCYSFYNKLSLKHICAGIHCDFIRAASHVGLVGLDGESRRRPCSVFASFKEF